MKGVTIKSTNREKENKSWFKVFNCFDSSFLSKCEENQAVSRFTLKEVCIKPNMGFVPHRHKNRDFIIIPIQGRLAQKNNLGQSYLAKRGDIHFMSTGSGITHFEYNYSSTEELNCVVLEVLPIEFDKKPVCLTVTLNTQINKLEKIIPVDKKIKKQVFMNNVTTYFGVYEKEYKQDFCPTELSNNVLIYVIEGSISINGKLINAKDTFGVQNESNIKLEARVPTQILLFEILN
jgi:redox-sensitive bicupin YhaK (pirin superfamily)